MELFRVIEKLKQQTIQFYIDNTNKTIKETAEEIAIFIKKL